MATTTYFGWETPDDTDLVKDGAAAIRTLGSAIDTSMSQLEGGTTGQILSKTSATDMAFTWTTPNPGDITGVTAGTGISGGGTSGDVTVTNSMATAITTAGDLIKGTGSGTFNRLGIGSTSQVLTVVSGAPAWATPTAGSLTLLSTTTASGTSVTISSISTAYEQLLITCEGIFPTTSAEDLRFQVNGNTGTIYNVQMGSTGSSTLNSSATGTSGKFMQDISAAGNTANFASIIFPNYTSSTANKLIYGSHSATFSGTTSGNWGFGFVATTTAITSILFKWGSAGTLTFSAGTIKIYGVK